MGPDSRATVIRIATMRRATNPQNAMDFEWRMDPRL